MDGEKEEREQIRVRDVVRLYIHYIMVRTGYHGYKPTLFPGAELLSKYMYYLIMNVNILGQKKTKQQQ